VAYLIVDYVTFTLIGYGKTTNHSSLNLSVQIVSHHVIKCSYVYVSYHYLV